MTLICIELVSVSWTVMVPPIAAPAENAGKSTCATSLDAGTTIGPAETAENAGTLARSR